VCVLTKTIARGSEIYVLQCAAVCCSLAVCVAVCVACGHEICVLQYVAVCCSMLQCVAVSVAVWFV